jgi:hypothetical protein
MRQLKIDLSELEQAFDSDDDEILYYMDIETGRLVVYSDEDRNLAQRVEDGFYNEKSQYVDWEAAIDALCIADWQQEVVREAFEVEGDTGERYIAVPPRRSHEGYQEMVDYINTVSDQRLAGRLEGAISGRGAFRRFKDALLDYPEQRERWFQFKQERLREAALNWLKELKIEAV